MNAASFENPLDFAARPTPRLRDAVKQQQRLLPPDEFTAMVGVIRTVFEKFTAKLLEFAPGIERGRALHQMMDREMKAASQFAISCRKGCTGCCHYEVEITQNEAAVLKKAVDDGFAIDRDRLDLQAERERRSPEWQRFGSRDNRCVFLGEDGACGVYEDRPAICRKHVVTTPVAACSTPGAAVAPIQVLLAEILLSAELSIEGTPFGSLSKMLLNSLQETAARRAPETNVPSKIRLRVARNRPGRISAESDHPAVPSHANAMLL
jgi:Fe-S-cluster containining protein